jgi:hypothetical protein
MSEETTAWVWSQYRGVATEPGSRASGVAESTTRENDRVVSIRSVYTNEAAQRATTSSASATKSRSKIGALVAISVLTGLLFPMISILLLILAALMIASGQEPERTEKFLTGLPGGALLLTLLAQVDRLLG